MGNFLDFEVSGRASLAASVICRGIVIALQNILSKNVSADVRNIFSANRRNQFNWEG
jgi:hypothetical protein